MGTIHFLVAVDAQRTFDLDKFYNRHCAYEALTTLAPWGNRGCWEVTPAVLRAAAAQTRSMTPDLADGEDEEDRDHGAWKLEQAAVWMERVGSAIAYFVNDGMDSWEEQVFALSPEQQRSMTTSEEWDHYTQSRNWPEDGPYDEVKS